MGGELTLSKDNPSYRMGIFQQAEKSLAGDLNGRDGNFFCGIQLSCFVDRPRVSITQSGKIHEPHQVSYRKKMGKKFRGSTWSNMVHYTIDTDCGNAKRRFIVLPLHSECYRLHVHSSQFTFKFFDPRLHGLYGFFQHTSCICKRSGVYLARFWGSLNSRTCWF